MQEAKTYWLGEKDFSYSWGMDSVRELIIEKAPEFGGLAEMSRKVGRNHAYFQQFVKRGVPSELPEKVRGRLAQLIGVDEDQLRSADKPTQSPRPESPRPPQNAQVAGPIQMGFTIPAYGHARGGRDGQFVLNGNRVADILAPPSLIGVRNAFAVYVAGTSMEPRYHPGEAVFVNPGLPVKQGDYVIAQIATNEGDPPDAFVKRFVSWDDQYLKLAQLKPPKVLKFRTDKVVSVYRIVMGGDG